MFTPSRYQQAIFDHIETQPGHVQISAVAGSGKTTTLIELLKRLPQSLLQESLMCAFNKEIQEELQRRAPAGVTVKTNHAIGFRTLAKHFTRHTGIWRPKVDGRKYRELIEVYALNNNWREYERRPDDKEDELFQLVHFCRVTLTNPRDTDAVEALISDNELTLSQPEVQLEALSRVLKWGVEGIPHRRRDRRPALGADEVIDFDDMIWLPAELHLQPDTYRLVLVDECQDLNAAQLSLVLSSLAPDGRLIAVGDPRQAIYAFCGADARSWQKIAQHTSAAQLPLSVCYRCPTSVIALAQEIVPEIEAHDQAPAGIVEIIKDTTFNQMVSPADMVLCRTTAPLISTAFALLGQGKAARVRGRDVGAQLLKLIDTLEQYPGFRWDNFHECITAWANTQRHNLSQKKNAEQELQALADRVDSLQAIQQGAVERGAHSLADLREWTNSLFEDRDSSNSITLSTIHRAKGLEAPRVFVLRPELMPHPMAKTPAAREQEENLRYVACTRARQELYLVQATSAKK